MSCSCKRKCGDISCEGIIALTVILALGVIFFKGFNDGIFATVIALAAILAL